MEIKIVATALRCGNEQAVREGRPAAFSGINVEMVLTWIHIRKLMDRNSLALPCAAPWPSKVTMEKKGEN